MYFIAISQAPVYEIHMTFIFMFHLCIIPANTKRFKHVIITSKRRFDVIIAYLLRCVFAGIHSV